jgi:hypothetical protein
MGAGYSVISTYPCEPKQTVKRFSAKTPRFTGSRTVCLTPWLTDRLSPCRPNLRPHVVEPTFSTRGLPRKLVFLPERTKRVVSTKNGKLRKLRKLRKRGFEGHEANAALARKRDSQPIADLNRRGETTWPAQILHNLPIDCG